MKNDAAFIGPAADLVQLVAAALIWGVWGIASNDAKMDVFALLAKLGCVITHP